jgi:hypothetical protein
MVRPTPSQRYEEKVDRTGGQDACHPWLASVNEHGYGIFRADGRMHLAHRWAYRHFIGPVELPQVIRHRCDTPACQNPRHWIKGTQAENIADMIARGRSPDRRGERSGRARLTEADVRMIRASAGPHARLAKEYGVSPSLIGQIRAGTAWRHVPW